jgi:hypothetical protein
MNDRQIADIVNELTTVAKEFHNTQQLRERIARVVVPHLKQAQRWEQDSINLGWIENPDRMGQ